MRYCVITVIVVIEDEEDAHQVGTDRAWEEVPGSPLASSWTRNFLRCRPTYCRCKVTCNDDDDDYVMMILGTIPLTKFMIRDTLLTKLRHRGVHLGGCGESSVRIRFQHRLHLPAFQAQFQESTVSGQASLSPLRTPTSCWTGSTTCSAICRRRRWRWRLVQTFVKLSCYTPAMSYMLLYQQCECTKLLI